MRKVKGNNETKENAHSGIERWINHRNFELIAPFMEWRREKQMTSFNYWQLKVEYIEVYDDIRECCTLHTVYMNGWDRMSFIRKNG